MATIQQEITDIAVAQGYEGDAPQTIAQAVNALGSVMGGGGVKILNFTTTDGEKDFVSPLTNKEICDLVASSTMVFANLGYFGLIPLTRVYDVADEYCEVSFAAVYQCHIRAGHAETIVYGLNPVQTTRSNTGWTRVEQKIASSS